MRDTWKSWLPSATAAFTPQYVTPPGFFAPAGTWAAVLQLQVPIYDGSLGATKRLRIADRETAQLRLDAVKLGARSELRFAEEAVVRNEQIVATTRRSAADAAEALRITGDRLQGGRDDERRGRPGPADGAQRRGHGGAGRGSPAPGAPRSAGGPGAVPAVGREARRRAAPRAAPVLNYIGRGAAQRHRLDVASCRFAYPHCCCVRMRGSERQQDTQAAALRRAPASLKLHWSWRGSAPRLDARSSCFAYPHCCCRADAWKRVAARHKAARCAARRPVLNYIGRGAAQRHALAPFARPALRIRTAAAVRMRGSECQQDTRRRAAPRAGQSCLLHWPWRGSAPRLDTRSSCFAYPHCCCRADCVEASGSRQT